ncbi:hypothetical protein [Zeaxanthinibacter enoshimensis]|uniref:hypothetical protein n=1 Tax=Zeaxanthinibacter enoshimensis TaxID=392009 RepID=UPI003563C5DA
MIRYLTRPAILFLGAITISCSSSDNSDGVIPPDDPDNESVTYTANIRPIIQSNCTSCHGNPPTQNAPMSLTTLQQVRSAVQSRNLLGRINSTTNPMPPDGLLPVSARNAIQAWVDAGFPE